MMSADERAQLIEDIQRSGTFRAHIVDQARADKEFDIGAAWQELDTLDRSILDRIGTLRRGGAETSPETQY